MSDEEYSKKMMFDAEAASLLVKELRGSFDSGRTRSYEWRVSQVKAFLKLMVDHEQQIVDALRSDLAKPPLETVVYEIGGAMKCHHLDRGENRWPSRNQTSEI